MKQTLSLLGTVSLSLFLGTSDAHAASQADLAVSMTAPAGLHHGESGRYTVKVENRGNRNAAGVSLTIALPRTHTSPTVHVLGTLGGKDARCAVSGTNLVCSLGTIARNASTTAWFDLALPYSTTALAITASATTTTLPESTLTNNSAARTVTTSAWPVSLAGDFTADHRHCTGTGLTSFFECELYPSSISGFVARFAADGDVTIDEAPDVTGAWWIDAQSVLHVEYADGAGPIGTITAPSVGGDCFEGPFDDGGSYAILYEICLVGL